MEYYTEPARRIPMAPRADVLVAGAGPAGFAAAVCAARLGAKTTLIEQTGDVGGVATTGLMSHWTGETHGGFYEELLDRSCDGESRQTINPEKLKTVMLGMLDEAKVSLRLYSFAGGVMTDGGRVGGIVTQSKSGREALPAKIVIDATGDGDIAAQAGVPYHKGREEDGLMQPMTLMFKVAGVDTSRAAFPCAFEDNVEIPLGKIQDLGKAHLPAPAGHVLLYRSTLPGIVTCNMTNCTGVDGTDARDLTRAASVCRSQIEPIVAFLRGYVPGYENCYVISSASVIGVRETRHFEGLYTLTQEDILTARVFDDWVVRRAHFGFDVHNMTGSGLDATGVQQRFPQREGYTIPYRCLVPKAVGGLLLAGRNISGTHLAHSSYRVMPICANIGQAAGIAAALCARKDISPAELDAAEIQSRLSR